ncbi:MAG: NHLP bacteriocin system secretion protein, partial [Alphaproteobacteria bacterium]
MAKQIFRQAALDRLASPEQLDRPYRLVAAPVWMALGVAIGATLLAVGWAAFATAPVKVEGGGIVLPEAGLLEIVADVDGRIETLALAPGGDVVEGASIATFARADIARDLELAEAERADAAARLGQLRDFFDRTDALQRAAEDERLDTIRQSRGHAERRRQLLSEKIESLRGLVQRNIVIRDRLLDAEVELAEARERLATLDDEAKSIELDRLDRRNEYSLQVIDEQRKVERLAREADRLARELAEKQAATSPHAGRVVEVRVNRGDVVARGAALAILAPLGAGAAETLGVLYLPPAEGKRVAVGMAAEVEPSTVRPEEYGFIRAVVASVSAVPVSLAGMRSTLKNDELAAELAA